MTHALNRLEVALDAAADTLECAELMAALGHDADAPVILDTAARQRAERARIERALPVAWHLKRLHASMYSAPYAHPITKRGAIVMRRELMADYKVMKGTYNER